MANPLATEGAVKGDLSRCSLEAHPNEQKLSGGQE